MSSRTISGLALRAWLGMNGAEIPKYSLPLQSGESAPPQNLVANIRGQIGFRACRCDICNRQAHALVCRGCQKSVDVARIRPAAHDRHFRDLSALVDFVSHDCEEVGTSRKQRVEVGHDVVLPDESMGPVELPIEVASHDSALVVDAAGYAAKISRQNTEGCKRVVLPKRAILGCAVGLPTNPTIWSWSLMLKARAKVPRS
jgi:hypothetical protein